MPFFLQHIFFSTRSGVEVSGKALAEWYLL